MPQASQKAKQKPVLIFFCDRVVAGTELSYEAELIEISSTTAGSVELDAVMSGVLDDLQVALTRHTNDERDILLHISTHGSKEGLSVQAKTWLKGATEAAKADQGSILRLNLKNVRGLLLAACDSSSFVGDAVAFKGLTYLVTMTDKVYDQAARAYARSFYSCLVANHRESLHEDLNAWANIVSAGCNAIVGDAASADLLQGLLRKETGPLPWVKCLDVSGKPVTWLAFGPVTFSSSVPLVRDDDDATDREKGKSKGNSLTIPAPALSSIRSKRGVRALTSIPLTSDSIVEVHIVSTAQATLLGLLTAASIAAIFAVLWLSRGSLPAIAALGGTSIPILLTFTTAAIGAIGGISPLTRHAKKSIGGAVVSANVALVLFVLVNLWASRALTNNSGEPIAAPGRWYGPGETMLVTHDWDAGPRFRTDGTSVTCANTAWQPFASDAGAVPIWDGGPCPREGADIDASTTIDVSRRIAPDESATTSYLATLRPDPAFAGKGYTNPNPAWASVQRWTPATIRRAPKDTSFLFSIDPYTTFEVALKGPAGIPDPDAQLHLPEGLPVTIKAGGSTWTWDRACSDLGFVSTDSPDTAKWRIKEVRQQVATRDTGSKASSNRLMLCAFAARTHLTFSKEVPITSDTEVLLRLPEELVPDELTSNATSSSIRCPRGPGLTTVVGVVNHARCKHKSAVQLSHLPSFDLACWSTNDSDVDPNSKDRGKDEACPRAAELYCTCEGTACPSPLRLEPSVGDGCKKAKEKGCKICW